MFYYSELEEGGSNVLESLLYQLFAIWCFEHTRDGLMK